MALAYSPDGAVLASASADGSARVWDAKTGRLLHILQSPADRAQCVAFAPDGKLLAVGYHQPYGYVQTWELQPLRRREQWAAHSRSTRSVVFRDGGRQLITGGNDSAPRFWDANSFASLESPRPSKSSVMAMALRPDGQGLAALTISPASLHMWTLVAESPRSRRFLPSTNGFALQFTPDGSRLVCGLEREIAIVVPTDRRMAPLHWPAHDGDVLGIAVRRDGQSLLSAGADGFVKHWSLEGRLIDSTDWQIGELGAVAISPDGFTAAIGGAERIVIWDLEG